MAKEAAEAFVKRYASDEAFRTRVNGLDSPQAIRTFLDEQGLGQFTRQELEDARSAASAAGELSDAELEAVAGGAWYVWDQSTTCESSYTGDDSGEVNCSGAYSVTCSSVW